MAASANSPKVGMRRRSGKSPLQDKVLNQTSPKKKSQQTPKRQKLRSEKETDRKSQPEHRRSRRSGSSVDRVLEPDDQDENTESANGDGSSAPSATPTPSPPSPSVASATSKRKRKLDLDDSFTQLDSQSKEKVMKSSSVGKQPVPSPTKYVANSSGKIIVGTRRKEGDSIEEKKEGKAGRGDQRKEETSTVKFNDPKTNDFVISFDMNDLSASILSTDKKPEQRKGKRQPMQPTDVSDLSISCRHDSCLFSASTERLLLTHVRRSHVTMPGVVMCRNRVDYRDEKKKCRDCERLLSASSLRGSSTIGVGETFGLNSPRKTKKSILSAMAFDLRDDFDSDDEDVQNSSLAGGFDVEACVAEVKLTEEEQRQVEEREEETRRERERKEKERMKEEKEKERREKEKERKEEKEKQRKEKQKESKVKEEEKMSEELHKKKSLKGNASANDLSKVKSSSASRRSNASRRSGDSNKDFGGTLTSSNAEQERFQPFVILKRQDAQFKQDESKAIVAAKVTETAKNVSSQRRRSARRS